MADREQSFPQRMAEMILGGSADTKTIEMIKPKLASELGSTPSRFQLHLDTGCAKCKDQSEETQLCLAGKSAYRWDEAFRKMALS